MNTLRLTYGGRISAGRLKRTNYENHVPGKTDEQKYSELVFSVHGFEEALRLRRTLGLSNLSKSQNEGIEPVRAVRGLKGISSRGREAVRSTSQLMEDRYSKGRLSFLTLTIPEECLSERLLERWEGLVKNLKTWLLYQLRRVGLPQEIVAVVEVQKRSRGVNGELPGLHIHAIFCGRLPGKPWKLSKHLFQEYWNKALLKASGHVPQSSVSSRVERVRKSASGYLGKYMSKGAKAISRFKPKYLPKSWYICTLNLRRDIKRLELYVTGKQATLLYDWLSDGNSLLSFSKLVTLIDERGWTIPVGWYGQVASRDDYWALYEYWIDFLDTSERSGCTNLTAT